MNADSSGKSSVAPEPATQGILTKPEQPESKGAGEQDAEKPNQSQGKGQAEQVED